MTPPERPEERPGDGSAAARAARARRMAEIFGEVLPDQTRDDAAGASLSEERAREQQLLRDVPPHHGA